MVDYDGDRTLEGFEKFLNEGGKAAPAEDDAEGDEDKVFKMFTSLCQLSHIIVDNRMP